MRMKDDAKFEEDLTCQFKNDEEFDKLTNFDASTRIDKQVESPKS